MNVSGALEALAAAGLVMVLAGCAGGDKAVIRQSGSEAVGEVIPTSDDSTDTVEALCVSDIPDDLTACPGAPAGTGCASTVNRCPGSKVSSRTATRCCAFPRRSSRAPKKLC